MHTHDGIDQKLVSPDHKPLLLHTEGQSVTEWSLKSVVYDASRVGGAAGVVDGCGGSVGVFMFMVVVRDRL